MQTQRLTTLSSPSHTQSMMETCARSLGLLPEHACHVRESWRLPADLHDTAERADRDGEIWSGWSDGRMAWLLTGHLVIESARERGQPVLEIRVYQNGDAGCCSVVATHTPDGAWRACGA